MENNTEKKLTSAIKAWTQTTNGAIIISVAVATPSAMLFLPTSGILSTFPIVFSVSFFAAYFLKRFYCLPAAFCVMTYILSNALWQPLALAGIYGSYSLRSALRAAVLSLLGCLAARVIKNASALFKRKWVTFAVAVFLFAISLIWVGLSNGTPWAAIKANGDINKYVDAHFDLKGIEKTKVYYVAESGAFAVDFRIEDKKADSTLTINNGVISENVTEMYSEVISEEKRLALTELFRQSFPNSNFVVNCEYSGIYSKKLSLNDTASVSSFLKYTVDIYDMSNAKTFAERAEGFYNAVAKAGFACDDLTLNGGIRKKLYYSISGNPYIPQAESAKRLELFGNTTMPSSSIELARSFWKQTDN